MHARVQRYALSAAIALTMLLVGKVAEAQNLRVIAVPWVATAPEFPHTAYNDHATTFKAIARGGDGSYTVSWDFEGDGVFDTTFTRVGVQRYDLSTRYTYPDVAVDTDYVAVVRVVSGTETVTDTYPVRIRAAVPAVPDDTTSDLHLQYMRNVQIDDGLWYLHTRMQRSGDEDGANGNQITGYIYDANLWSDTASFLWSLGQHHHFVAYPDSYVGALPGSNTVRWEQDPYAEDAARIVNYFLTQIVIQTGLAAQDESNLVGFPEVDQPAIPGTDDGRGFYVGDTLTYAMGHVLASLGVARLDDYVAQVGDPDDVLGRPMDYLLQQMVDWMVWSQSDNDSGTTTSPLGSWHYEPNTNGDDQSTTLWGVTGLWQVDRGARAARSNVIVNNFVKARAVQYLVRNARTNPSNSAQRCGAYRTSDGGCGFTTTAADVLTLGWVGANGFALTDTDLAFPGYNTLEKGALRDLYDDTVAFIGGNFTGLVNGSISWNIGMIEGGNFSRSDGRGNHYSMLHWQDAAIASEPAIALYGTHDWKRLFTYYLQRNQYPDGRWESVGNATNNYSDQSVNAASKTGWSLLIVDPELPPVPVAIATPNPTPEGTTVTFDGSQSTPGDAASATYVWDFGDGSPTVASQNATHLYEDDGTYIATLTATSTIGSSIDTVTIVVTDVPLVVTSTPPAFAYQDTEYTYEITYTAGAFDVVACTLPLPRPGMTITGCTVTWTSPQLGEDGPVRVCAQDEDGGGPVCQDYFLLVRILDTDNDGLPDQWEMAEFGDLTHGATGDEDEDGVGNRDEYANGTDPNGYDGPDPSTSVSACGDQVDVFDPTLTIDIGIDPNDDALTYQFQVFRDASLTDMVGQVDVVDDGADLFVDAYLDPEAVPPIILEENTWYFWRARARDQWVGGEWSEVCDFFVNTENDAPTAPRVNSPSIGSWVNDLTPELVVDNATDPDALDVLQYRFELYSNAAMTTLVASQSGVTPADEAITFWVDTVTLTEDATYWWRARATDQDGESGAWSDTGVFTVNTENSPPEAPVIVAPQNATVVAVLRPGLIVLNTDDPDFDTLVYDWELATDTTFSDVIDSGDDQAQGGPATTQFTLAADLEEDTRYCWRVRADDGTATSAYAVACFWVSQLNDPPSVPTLMNPGNDTVVRTTSPTFSWAPAVDPEGRAVSYDVEVMNADGDVIATALGVSGTVTAMAEELEDGEDYTWRARAVDAEGEASQFSEANEFAVALPGDEGDGDPDLVVNGDGCSAGGTGGGGLALLALGLVGALCRRRRR